MAMMKANTIRSADNGTSAIAESDNEETSRHD
jgi:hypothetical protein